MFKHLKLCISLFFLLLATTNCIAKPHAIENCNGTACTQVAQKVEWPEALVKSIFSMEAGKFKFSIPDQPKRVIGQLGGDVAILTDETFFDFTLQKHYVEIDPENVDVPKNITYSVADAAQLTFTKTINDIPPKNAADLWVWKRALVIKQQHFSNDAKVFTASKSGITIYFGQLEDNSAMAYIFEAKQSDCYAFVYAKNIDFDKFKSIIATVRVD